MKKEDVIKKLENIAQNIDKAFCMTIDSIWLFGSSLYKEEPRDVDIIVAYHMTPKQQQEYNAYFDEEIKRLSLCDFWRARNTTKTSVLLKNGIKNIDIMFIGSIGSDLEWKALTTKCFILAWSRERPNIRENLLNAGYGSQLVKLLGEEIGSMRSQLKGKTEEVEVLERIYRYLAYNIGDKGEALLARFILDKTPKREVSEKRIREILKEHDLPEEWIVAERSKYSKVRYELIKEKRHFYYDK